MTKASRSSMMLVEVAMSKSSRPIEQLIEAGEQLFESGQAKNALVEFHRAWDDLPDPKEEHESAVEILAACADCHFALGQWNECCKAVQQAFRCGADVSTIFLRLRLGESLYELGDETEAANWLVPVYLMEGRAPFADDDPKYLEFFRSKLKAPEDGWPEGW